MIGACFLEVFGISPYVLVFVKVPPSHDANKPYRFRAQRPIQEVEI